MVGHKNDETQYRQDFQRTYIYNIKTLVSLDIYENYCIKSFWPDAEYERLQFRIEKKHPNSNTQEEDKIRECLKDKFQGKTIYLPKDQAAMNSYVWAIVFDDWYNTSWENIEGEIPGSIKELISDINAAMSPS